MMGNDPVATAREQFRLGLLARSRGDRLSALAHLEQAAELNPGDIRARIELARELAEMGYQERAAAVLRTILREAPGQPQAQALLDRLANT